MSLSTGQFEQFAELVTERTAELFSAEVRVTDERGVVVACSSRRAADRSDQSDRPGRSSSVGAVKELLRLPIRLDTHRGEIIINEPANGEVVPPKLAEALIDLMINQAVSARLPNQYELKNKFIHDLLVGQIADDSDIAREGHILGMDLSRPRAVVLIDASSYILNAGSTDLDPDGAGIRRRAQFVIGSAVNFFHLQNDAICGYIGNGEIAILKASTTQDLEAWTADGVRPRPAPSWANLSALKRAGGALLARLQQDTGEAINIGIGRYHPGVPGLSLSYRDAHIALTLGRRLHGDNRVHCLDSLGIAAFVGVDDQTTKLDLARHLLAPLDTETELLRTLEVFFEENCSPSVSAERLAIHRNTLAYRLDKISALLDLDPRQFSDAVQIRVAMLTRSVQSI